MINIRPGERTRAAIDRCRIAHPKVRALDLATNLFEVSGRRGNHYQVRLDFRNGLKLALCNCAAGKDGMLCYHAVAAMGVEHGIRRRWKSPGHSRMRPEELGQGPKPETLSRQL